ncbi:MAG: SDR family NAD(P)-dependent oxidoreductase, partial [Lachnospiraceae bacterium]|nr:SDR family NAD(P)-dependent oxidoreductase [Lachnospiraceae bacterium]
MTKHDFNGKTVLITGAATGIGAQCCRQFAEAGAFVALNYYPGERDEKESAKLVEEIRAAGGKIERYGVDVSIEEDVYHMIDEIVEKTGRIDVVVNNAMTGYRAPFDELTSEMLWHMMRVNFGGAFYTCKRAIPYMLKQGSGNVVMVSSSAFINGGGATAAYPAAKGAMEGLMSGLVNEYAKYGLRFNTVRPSVVF